MNSRTIFQGLGIAALLFVLLIVGGWAFVAGIGLLFALAYRKNKNRGSLIAAGSFIGLGLGLLIELLLGREGGVAMMLGIAIGLLGIAFVLWVEREAINGTAIGLSLCLFVLTAMLWSYSMEGLSLYLFIFPFGVMTLLLAAGYFYRRDKVAH